MKIESGIWKGWKVWIESDGKKLPEYQVVETKDERNTMITRANLFVESTVGQSFRIRARQPAKSDTGVSVTFSVDGKHIDGVAILPEDGPARADCWSFSDLVDGVLCDRDLMFGKLKLTEGDSDLTDNHLKSLGTVAVCLDKGDYELAYNTMRPTSDVKSVAINEKTKKGMLGMTVVGGAPTRAMSAPLYDFEPDLPLQSYIVTFSYRSRELLMAQDIIPKPEAQDVIPESKNVKRPSGVQEKHKPAIKRAKVKRASGAGSSKSTAIAVHNKPRRAGSSKSTVISVHNRRVRNSLGMSKETAIDLT